MLPGDQYSESSQTHYDEFLVTSIAILYAAFVRGVEHTLQHIILYYIILYYIIL
jgi:hypothetical protein